MGNLQSNTNFTSQYSISTDEVWRSERGWRLYDAVNKQQTNRESSDNGEVSVFVYTSNSERGIDTSSSSQLFSLAINFHKRFKTLRHPYLLPYRDGAVVEDKIYIVTERVVPLRRKLPELTQYSWGLSWGIYQIAVRSLLPVVIENYTHGHYHTCSLAYKHIVHTPHNLGDRKKVPKNGLTFSLNDLFF
jgi:hypothetical protein